MNRGIEIGDSAMHILQGHAGDITSARERVEHLKGTRGELMEAIAYLSCQVWAYRNRSDEDAAIALTQIRLSLNDYEARQAMKP